MNTLFGKVETEQEVEKAKKSASIPYYEFTKVICTKDGIEKVEPFIDTYKYSQFMINQALCQEIQIGYDKNSMFESWRIIKELNIMKISNRAHFNLLFQIIPKNAGYIKYRFKHVESKEEKINALKWYFKNEKEETIYKFVNIISDEEVNEIMAEYEIFKKIGGKK